MIFTLLLKAAEYLLDVFLVLLDMFPSVPVEIKTVSDQFFSLLFENCSIISFFLPMDFVLIILPLSILVAQSDKIYSVVMWIARKIPFLGFE